MKVDLTNMTVAQRIDAIERYVLTRMNTATKRTSDTVFATDIAGHFKHRGLRTHQERVKFYSGMIVSVLTRAKRAAMRQT